MTYLKSVKIIPSVPDENNRKSSISVVQKINKGELNKIKIRPPTLTSSQESSREVQGTVAGNKLNHSAVTTGPFQVGETITGGTSTATGTVDIVGANYIEYTPVTGTFVAAELITGGTSTATTTTTTVTVANIVGQVFRLHTDNISELLLTLETSPESSKLDTFEANQTNMQLMWTTAGVAALRDTTNKAEGAASIKLEHSVATTYTHAVSFIGHGAVTGTFQLNETITGGTSAATAVVGEIDSRLGILRLVSITGTFQSGEVITGGTSAATATTSSLLKTTSDWSVHELITFEMLINTKIDQHITFSITDGTNTASETLSVPTIGTWYKKSINIDGLASAGTPGVVDTSAISSCSFITANKFKNGYKTNIDNLLMSGFSGDVDIQLWDMGPSLPASGVAKLTDGTRKQLGDIGINGSQALDIHLELFGGKRLYTISDFSHGASKEMPSNTLLSSGNYYAIALNYSDTDVKVYGSDSSLLTNYYPEGYSYNSPGSGSIMSGHAFFGDCMFSILSAEPIWITSYSITPDADAGDGQVLTVVEDTGMKMRVLSRGPIVGQLETAVDISDQPAYMPSGGKFEVYYTDDFSSNISKLRVNVEYMSKDKDAYIANPQ